MIHLYGTSRELTIFHFLLTFNKEMAGGKVRVISHLIATMIL